MKLKKKNRTEDNIQKYSPQWMNKYHLWVKKGKPKEFTVYLLHDKNLKVKKLGRSTKIWARVFNGLNHRYFFNFNLLDLKYFKNKSETIRYEKKLKKMFKKTRVEVLTYAYNQRKDGKSLKPKETSGTLANGGKECYEEKSVPNSFMKIDKILKKNLKYLND